MTALVPQRAVLAAQPVQVPEGGEVAQYEPMQFQLKIEAAGQPAGRALPHRVAGRERGRAGERGHRHPERGRHSVRGGRGRRTGGVFPVNLGGSSRAWSSRCPETTSTLVTGLQPGGGYDVTAEKQGGNISVKVSSGSAQKADDGGVLTVTVP